MVTSSDFSSSPYTPTTRKRAVTRPPMIADTRAVRAVLKERFPVRLASRRPAAQLHDIPAVYLPPTILPHEVPGSLVVLHFTRKPGSGLALDGCRVTRNLGVRSFDEVHALHLIERTLEDGPVRERA